MLFLAVALSRTGTMAELRSVARDRSFRAFAVGAVLTTGLLHFCIRPEFRVLTDETSLLGTSYSFHLDRTAQDIAEGNLALDRFYVIQAQMPARPVLFPFLASLLHDVLGFDPAHGFAVNAVACALTLALLGYAAGRVRGWSFGFLTAMFLAAFPLYALSVSSGGFEALNLLLLTVTGIQLWRFLHKPTGESAELLVILGLLTAECRYESALVLVPIGVAAFLVRKRLASTPPWTIPGMIVTAVPLLWQRTLVSPLNIEDSGENAFPVAALPGHLWSAFLFFLNWPAGRFASIGLIFVLGIVGAVLLAGRAASRRREDPEQFAFLLLSATGLGLILLVQNSYYLGDMRRAFISRMGVSFVGVMSLCAAYAVVRLLHRWRSLSKPVMVVLALGVLAHGWSVAAANEAGRTLQLFREFRTIRRFLEDRPREDALIISSRPSLYASQGRSSVGFDWTRQHRDQILGALDRSVYREALVIQHVPVAGTGIGPDYAVDLDLEPIFTFPATAEENVRVSRVRR